MIRWMILTSTCLVRLFFFLLSSFLWFCNTSHGQARGECRDFRDANLVWHFRLEWQEWDDHDRIFFCYLSLVRRTMWYWDKKRSPGRNWIKLIKKKRTGIFGTVKCMIDVDQDPSSFDYHFEYDGPVITVQRLPRMIKALIVERQISQWGFCLLLSNSRLMQQRTMQEGYDIHDDWTVRGPSFLLLLQRLNWTRGKDLLELRASYQSWSLWSAII